MIHPCCLCLRDDFIPYSLTAHRRHNTLTLQLANVWKVTVSSIRRLAGLHLQTSASGLGTPQMTPTSTGNRLALSFFRESACKMPSPHPVDRKGQGRPLPSRSLVTEAWDTQLSPSSSREKSAEDFHMIP